MTARVLILVTHLLGAGHLTRAAAIARAFATGGHATTLVSGGMPTSIAISKDVTFLQLPPVHIRGTAFSHLLDENGAGVTNALLEERREILIDILQRQRPNILTTELFPFGRRVLADEFEAALRVARSMQPRPLILASVRDILVAPNKPERISQAMTRVEDFYDAVLVHGDPALAPLDLSWPVDEALRSRLRYTGYVDEGPVPDLDVVRAGIVVSGGSSAASLPLYRAALEASHSHTERRWHILVGRGISGDDFDALQHLAPPHVKVERARPDFRQLLARAELSISQAGYNTIVDILRSRVRSILVPFEGGHETEQRMRAERLRDAGLAQVLPEAELHEHSIAHAVEVAIARPVPPVPAIMLDGASRSVEVASELRLSPPSLSRRSLDWSVLRDAVDRSRDRGHEPVLWWRDDDAVADTPALDRLLRLAHGFEAGLALAAIPLRIEPSLPARLRDEPCVSVLVHGYRHANHASPGDKKAEFGAGRLPDVANRELHEGLEILTEVVGDKLLRVFVPP